MVKVMVAGYGGRLWWKVMVEGYGEGYGGRLWWNIMVEGHGEGYISAITNARMGAPRKLCYLTCLSYFMCLESSGRFKVS